MSETKGERRERKEQARRKMHVSGRSTILLYQLALRRAEEAKKKLKARDSSRGV